jgi:type 1 glutamine amidotransferase
LVLSLFLLGAWASVPHADEKKEPLRVCLIAGSTEYDPVKSLTILKEYLETKRGMKCTFLSATFGKDPKKDPSDLPGLENLDKCDVAVLFTRRLILQGEQLERLKKYCLSGKPLVGIRTASHGIQTWLDLDKEVFGGNYKNHYKEGPLTEVKFAGANKDHPILKGFETFKSKGSLYRNTGLSKDVQVLLDGTNNADKAIEPIAWTRTFKGGRIFYTSLGHQQDFTEPSFLRLLGNAILWTAQR